MDLGSKTQLRIPLIIGSISSIKVVEMHVT
jgi:hypothetical protein